jgi:hypothetical protein
MVRSTAITIQIMGISISITHLIILLPPFLNDSLEEIMGELRLGQFAK